MAEKILPGDSLKNLQEEASILYRLGVAIGDIEYVISKKLNALRLEPKTP